MAKGKRKRAGLAAEDLERLYIQPPERFTETRNALAKRLREEGDREGADEVKSLKKPSLAAWLVNQLGLREPDEVETLLAAGERLRKAEDAMMAGKGDADELRAAAAEERDAVGRLAATARRIAEDDDRTLTQATLDRVAETLQAAAADEQIAEQLRAGRLAKEARRATIGASTRAPVSRRGAGGAAKAKASRDREEARAALDGARRDLDRAEGVVERAQADVDHYTERLREAKNALTAAKRDAKQAASEVGRAERRPKKS
jgi:chromosome segregation ATPase